MRLGFPFRDRARLTPPPPLVCTDFVAATYDVGSGMTLQAHTVITSPASWSKSLAGYPYRIVPTAWQMTFDTADAGIILCLFSEPVVHYDSYGNQLWTWIPPGTVYDVAWHFNDREAVFPIMNGDEVDIWTVDLAGDDELRCTVDPSDDSVPSGTVVSCVLHTSGYLFLLHLASSNNAATIICADYDTGDLLWSLPVTSGANQFNELSCLRRGATSGDLFVATAESDGTYDQVVVQRHFFSGGAFYDPPSLVWSEEVTDGARDHMAMAFHTRWDGVFVGYTMNAEDDAHVVTSLDRFTGAILFTGGPSEAVEFTEPTCVGVATSVNNMELIVAIADDAEGESTIQRLRILDLMDDGAMLTTVPVDFVGPVDTVICPGIIPT